MASRAHKASQPFLFAIALKPKSASKDWDNVCQLLDGCLHSVFHQTHDDFHVALACHDEPAIKEQYRRDSRFILKQATFEADPTTYRGQVRDRNRKRRLMASLLRDLGGGYFFPVDADDWVASRTVEYVHTHDNRRGYLIESGYAFDLRNKQFLELSPSYGRFFYRHCGTCAVTYFGPDDLPGTALKTGSDPRTLYYEAFKNHTKWHEVASAWERPFEAFPFPAAVYVLGHGEHRSFLNPISSPDAPGKVDRYNKGVNIVAMSEVSRWFDLPRELY